MGAAGDEGDVSEGLVDRVAALKRAVDDLRAEVGTVAKWDLPILKRTVRLLIDSDAGRVSVAVTASAYGPCTRSDHPVQAMLADGLAGAQAADQSGEPGECG